MIGIEEKYSLLNISIFTSIYCVTSGVMAKLNPNEKRRLEQILSMSGGYVLDFSNDKFQEFVRDVTEIDIYEDKYAVNGGSKAKRLRAFWSIEPNTVVAPLIQALVDRWKADLLDRNEFDLQEYDWYIEACEIVKRLEQEPKDTISVEAYFEDIQSKILAAIDSAQFTIWVAVAWFTDRIIFEHLIEKTKQGINVQLLITDDEINAQSGLDYENHFETYRIENFGKYFNNQFHDKFCVIDLNTVVNGSYNWTNKARFNHEDATVTNSREYAEKFARRFIKLKNLHNLSNK